MRRLLTDGVLISRQFLIARREDEDRPRAVRVGCDLKPSTCVLLRALLSLQVSRCINEQPVAYRRRCQVERIAVELRLRGPILEYEGFGYTGRCGDARCFGSIETAFREESSNALKDEFAAVSPRQTRGIPAGLLGTDVGVPPMCGQRRERGYWLRKSERRSYRVHRSVFGRLRQPRA